MTALRLARITLVGFLAVALQVSVAAQLPISGAMVDVVLIATIAAGLAAGPEAGAGVGFGCGLVIDLLGVGPVGLTALVYTMIGYGVGVSQIGILRTSRLLPLVSATVAAAAAVLAYAWIGEVLGQHLFAVSDVPSVLVVVTVSTAVLVLPARRVMAWAFAEDDARRLQRVDRW